MREERQEIMAMRRKLGRTLQALRITNGFKSRYAVMRRSNYLNVAQIKQIEEGSAAYTIDSLYKYMEVIGAEIKIDKQ